MQADAAGGGELSPDVECPEVYRVVARESLLFVVGERRRDAAGHLRARLRGCHEDVAQITDAAAAQVGMAEAGDLGVGVVVAGAPARPLLPGIRTELHQTARHGRARERVPSAAGADERIDVPDQRLAGVRGWLLPGLRAGPARRPQTNTCRTLQHVPPGNHLTSSRYVS